MYPATQASFASSHINNLLFALVPLLLLTGCGDKPSEFVAPDVEKAWEEENPDKVKDSIKVASYNMFVGFPVEQLLVKDLSVEQVVFDEAASLYTQFLSSRHEDRIQIMADEISALDLDVVGLQEVSRLYYFDSLVADYPSLLVDKLNEIEPDSYAISYQKLNDISFDATDSVSGEDISLRFAEGNAILYKTEFSLIKERKKLFNASLGNVQVLDSVQKVERGFLHLTLVKDAPKNRNIEVITSHLEILSFVSQPQSEELLKDLKENVDSNSIQLLVGDWNATPGAGADTITKADGFIDTFAFGNSPEGGFTCCVADGNLVTDSPEEGNYSRRIDYVYAKNIIAAVESQVHLDTHFPLEDGLQISPADHAMIWSTLEIQH